MTAAFAFAGAHPWVPSFLAVLFTHFAGYYPAWTFNRYLRSRNIKLHGWPPAHLDADGDPIPPQAASKTSVVDSGIERLRQNGKIHRGVDI